jgi:hypothetical protein
MGILCGFVVSALFPIIRESYALFYTSDVIAYTSKLYSNFERFGLFIAIFSRNFTLVAILTLGPFFIAHQCIKQNKEPQLLLTLFTICSILAYGFFPYGLFLGHLFFEYQILTFLKWMLYFIPHGFFETFIILAAGSTGMEIKERFLKNSQITKIGPKDTIMKKLLLSAILLVVATIIEILISPFFLKIL